MCDHRKSFVLYKSLIHDIGPMPNYQAGELFQAILDYVNKNEPKVKKEWKALYDKIIEGIEYEWSKYNIKTKKYHWNYKGGISNGNRVIRNSYKMQYWRVNVFEHDQYTCRDCGKVGGELNAHHIKEFAKYPELRFEIDNGLTLCKTCHIKIHKKNV